MRPRTITRLLVANRGEVAQRVFATCRRLGIATVAVYSDADAGLPFVGEADVAYPLGGTTAADSYLRIERLIETARQAGVTAIHPGYGFLSENATFAHAVQSAGLIWIGPSPSVIEAMGLKTRARELMERAGVPVLPGRHLSGSESAEELSAAAEEVGLPLLVKAAAGGGGKGMRVVETADRLLSAVQAARREAGKAFGDDAVFLEQFAARSRHIEIQILGDHSGNVISLGERDCSIQRRHQKVIEESPSPALDSELREEISAAAVTAGREIGYIGAGTVEFLLAGRDFYFLEVNTRLQVEHPVTELVTGLDLVELQIRIAEGEPLAPDRPLARGHAIEARLYAEDPRQEFLPVTGTLTRFALAPGPRVDAGVASGSVIGPHYDPMIAKVIAHGTTRADSIRRLVDALRRAELHGIITNRDFLVRVLEHPEFTAGDADTSFLQRHDGGVLLEPLAGEQDEREAAAAAALALQLGRRRAARVLGSLPSGWRNVRALPQHTAFETATGDVLNVAYRFDRTGALESLTVNGEPSVSPRLFSTDGSVIDLAVGGRRRTYQVRSDGGLVHVNTTTTQIALRALPRHPVANAEHAPTGALTAPMPGLVLRVLTQVGASVDTGQALLVIEAMKMEHEIVAPASGTVTELAVAVGAQVQAGAMLAVIDDQEDG
jgi:acetyl/propionyl-CoA carboxylase alpha subunit